MNELSTQIQRIEDAKTAIKTSIENKGVVVGEGTIDTYASKIDEIITSGEGVDWKGTGYVFRNQEIANTINQEIADYSKKVMAEWNPNNTNASQMFYNDGLLVFMPLVDTSKLTNMYQMFDNCKNLRYVPDLNLSSVTNMEDAFDFDTNLEVVEITNTSKVTNMRSMFGACHRLKSVSQFDTSSVEKMNAMFQGSNILNVKDFDTALMNTTKTTDMSGMFRDLDNPTKWPVIDTSNAVVLSYFVADNNVLSTEPPLYNTAKAEDLRSMFEYCDNMPSVPAYNTSSAKRMERMFKFCCAITTIPQFDTRNAENMRDMFFSCNSLTDVPLLETPKVTEMDNIFTGCVNLTNLGGFKDLKCDLDLSENGKVTKESALNIIREASDLKTLGLPQKTITLHRTTYDALTPDDLAIATGKGWNVIRQ